MIHNYCSTYLVVIDGDVQVYKQEKCKVHQPFLSFQPKQIFIDKTKVREVTQFSEANDSSDFDGNTNSLECQDNEYVNSSGCEINKFRTADKIIL